MPSSRLSLLATALLGAAGSIASPSPAEVVKTVTAAPSIPSEAPQFVSHDAFTSAVLNSTNFFRTEHNASWIRWNDTLERFGQDYLDGNRDCRFAHSGGPYGENIALGCSDVTGCVDLWGNERKDYDFKKGDFTEDTGHFTQLVWKNSTQVGCGRKLCGDRGWYLVCEYWPRGNVIGYFKEEVNVQTNGTGSGALALRPGGLCQILVWPVAVMTALTAVAW